MAERRKVSRQPLLYYGRVYNDAVQKLLGYLVDITEYGFMLLSDEPYPINETRPIKIEITDDLSTRPYLRVKARSIWCEHDIDPTHYNTGFEILDLKPEDRQLIQSIIEKYSFHNTAGVH